MRIFTFFLLLIGFSLPCFSQIYVDNVTGNDINPGTVSTAPKKTIRAAVSASAPNGIVLVQSGIYPESSDILISQPITVTKATPASDVTINAQARTGNTNTFFTIDNTTNVVINGIKMKKLKGDGVTAIEIKNRCRSITISNCSFDSIGWSYNLTDLPASQSVSAIKAINATALPDSNILIRRNIVSNCAVGRGEAITITGNVGSFIIDSNVVHHIANIGIDAAGSYLIGTDPATRNYRSRNGKILHNEVYNCMSRLAASAAIYLDGSDSCLVEGNLVYNCGVGISIGSEETTAKPPRGHVIRNNTIRDNAFSGMEIGCTDQSRFIKQINILGNTFFKNRTMAAINGITSVQGINLSDSSYGGEIAFQNTDSILLQDNMIHRKDFRRVWYIRPAQAVRNFLSDYNDYYSDIFPGSTSIISIDSARFNTSSITQTGYATLESFRAAWPPQEAATLQAYAKFSDTAARNLRLALTSPVINMGNPSVTTALAGASDMDGSPRIICNRIDIGAFEAGTATPQPTITPAGPLFICAGASVTLTSSAAAGNQWYLAGNPISGENSTTYAASATGAYTVTSTQNGCTSTPSAAVSLTVTPTPATPAITPSGNQSFCDGQSLVLTSSAASGNQWYSGTTALTGAAGTAYTATLAGTYTVKVFQNSCPSAASNAVVITVNHIPDTPMISPSGNISACPAAFIQLTSLSAAGNQWYLNGGLLSGATAQIYSTSQPGSYTVKVTIAGCPSTMSAATVFSTGSTPAAPVITALGPLSFCEGDSVKLVSGILNNNQWYLNGVAILNATASFYTAKVSGSYTVRQNISGCTSALSNAINVNVLPNPAVPTITLVPGNLLKATAGFNTYNWFFNNPANLIATGDTYNPGTSYGVYYVRAFNAANCSSLSAPYSYNPGLNSSDSSITVYGNPIINTTLTLMLRNFVNNKFYGQIFNAAGQSMMITPVLTNGLNYVDVSGMAAGTYVVSITSDTQYKEKIKFVILR